MGHLRDKYGPKLYNKDDSLTMYSLACGYREKKVISGKGYYVQITLEKDSACYHVKICSEVDGYSNIWESFDTLTQARKFYKSRIKLVVLKVTLELDIIDDMY